MSLGLSPVNAPTRSGGGAPFAGEAPLALLTSDVIEGLSVVAYGDSYTAGRGGTQYPMRNWYDRIVDRIRSAHGQFQGPTPALMSANAAVGGMTTPDMAMYAYGTLTAQAGGGPAVTGTFPTAAFIGGFVVLFGGNNDAGYDGKGGTPAQHRAGFSNALNALIRLARAGVRTEDTAAAFAYTGTWAANTGQGGMSGGTNHATSTPGDKVTITTPVGTDFDVILACVDQGTIAGGGASFSITVDGSAYVPPYGPSTTQNQMQSSGGSQFNLGYCPLAIPFHGLSNAAHTIVITHTGTAGQFLFVDCMLTQTATPPTVLVVRTPHKGAAGYNWYNTTGGSSGASAATDDIYNGLIATLLQQFPNDGSVISWDPNVNGWLPVYGAGGHLSSGDPIFLHPNDAGSAFLADGIFQVLNALPARQGMVTV